MKYKQGSQKFRCPLESIYLHHVILNVPNFLCLQTLASKSPLKISRNESVKEWSSLVSVCIWYHCWE